MHFFLIVFRQKGPKLTKRDPIAPGFIVRYVQSCWGKELRTVPVQLALIIRDETETTQLNTVSYSAQMLKTSVKRQRSSSTTRLSVSLRGCSLKHDFKMLLSNRKPEKIVLYL